MLPSGGRAAEAGRAANAKTLRQKRAKSDYVAIVPGSCLKGTVRIKFVLHPEGTWAWTARESSTSEWPLRSWEVSQIGQSHQNEMQLPRHLILFKS